MVEQVAIAIPDFLRKIFIYNGYILQIGDNDKKKKYEGKEVANNEGVVRELQEDLKTLEYDAICGDPDGDFGLLTYRAVRAFQFDYIDKYNTNTGLLNTDIIGFYDYQGIKTNGIVNWATSKAIKEECENKNVTYDWSQPILLEVQAETTPGIWGGGEELKLEKSAAYDFMKLLQDVRAESGKLQINSMFRPHNSQVRTKAKKCKDGKCKIAATPGTSSHGFGCAMDVNRNNLRLIYNRPTSLTGSRPKISDAHGKKNLDRFRELALKNGWYPIAYKGSSYSHATYGYGSEAWHFNHTPVHIPKGKRSYRTITLRKSSRARFDNDPYWKICCNESGNEYTFRVEKCTSNVEMNNILSLCDCATKYPSIPVNKIHVRTMEAHVWRQILDEL